MRNPLPALALLAALLPTVAAAAPVDPATFVTCLYLALLQRAPDAGGLAYWSGRLAGGMTQQQVTDAFRASAEFQASKISRVYPALPTDIADVNIVRNATYTGGPFGYVNSALRVTENVGPGVNSFEWPILSILNVNGGTGQHVAVYGQANVVNGGVGWAGVLEANADGQGTVAVGLELDCHATNGGRAFCLDARDVGGSKGVLRVPTGVPILVSAYDETTYLQFIPGGMVLMSGGHQVAVWK